MELRSVRCLHEEPNETSRLLQFELDMIDVKKFGLDADSDQKLLDLISSEMTDPSCFFQSLDVQYPVEKGKCRLQIDAKVQRNCRQEEWHSDLLVPHSKLYRSYEDFMEKQIHRLLEELNYFRFVDGITVAYFYSESNHTTVVLLLDMDVQHLGQKSFTISSISQSISDRLQEQQSCDGISLLVNNVEYESGYWVKPYFSTTMTMVLRCNNGCESKELRHKFMQRLLDLGGSGRVGKVNTIYRGPNDEWKLFQVDFDVSDVFELELDTSHIILLTKDRLSNSPIYLPIKLSSQYPVEKYRYRISIDAEVQQNCLPVKWLPVVLHPYSWAFEQYGDEVKNQVFNVLEEQNYLRFLNSITVAYFYPRGDKLSVVLHLELNRPHVDHEAINISSISESISDGLFNQKHCNQTGHFWANVKYEAGNWTGSNLRKTYKRFTLTGFLLRNGTNTKWDENYKRKWSKQYRDALTVINHQMILLQELKNIYAWRNLITVDHFFEVENQVKVALYFYVPNSSLKDGTKNKYLVRELPDRIRYLNLRNGLRSKDIDLQADTPKKRHQLKDGSASRADMEYVS